MSLLVSLLVSLPAGFLRQRSDQDIERTAWRKKGVTATNFRLMLSRDAGNKRGLICMDPASVSLDPSSKKQLKILSFPGTRGRKTRLNLERFKIELLHLMLEGNKKGIPIRHGEWLN